MSFVIKKSLCRSDRTSPFFTKSSFRASSPLTTTIGSVPITKQNTSPYLFLSWSISDRDEGSTIPVVQKGPTCKSKYIFVNRNCLFDTIIRGVPSNYVKNIIVIMKVTYVLNKQQKKKFERERKTKNEKKRKGRKKERKKERKKKKKERKKKKEKKKKAWKKQKCILHLNATYPSFLWREYREVRAVTLSSIVYISMPRLTPTQHTLPRCILLQESWSQKGLILMT